MKRRLFRALVICGLSAFLLTQLFTMPAYASWGAARLAFLRAEQTPAPQPAPQPVPQPDPIPVPEPDPVQPPTVPADLSLTYEEEQLLNMVNEARRNAGLKPLIPMPELAKLARLKSQDMIDLDYFSHTSPTYGSFANMVYNAGIPFYSVGENLAKARTAKHAYYLFMGSTGHKNNILNPNFTHIGLGVIPYKYGVAVTQLFIMK